MRYYRAVGIRDYDWQPVGDDLKDGTWDYFGFDLPGHPNRVNLTAAAGAENEADGDDDNDVLLLRQTFAIPPLKEGCRYRIRILGSAHNNMGESYAIYVNGKLLFENGEGVTAWRRQGGSPRGVPIYPEFRALFKGGKMTIAVSSFAMDNFSADRFIPPGAPLSIWLEEMKIPPLDGVARP